MFVAGEAKVDLDGKAVAIRQDTRYPWDGTIRLTIDPGSRREFAIRVRIPGWAQNRPVPTDLYRYEERRSAKATIRINGRPVALDLDKGFARIRRTWKKGDRVDIELPMDARRIVAHPSVKDDEGFVAVERGPLVYCAEWPDNGGRVLNIVLPDTTRFKAETRPDLLGGIVVLTGDALAAGPAAVTRAEEGAAKDAAADDEENAPPASCRRLAPGAPLRPQRLMLIPYYAWAHRGDGEMSVWLFKSGTQYPFPN
jgi:DUF1680 family protein